MLLFLVEFGLTPWLVMDQDYRNFMTMHKAILLQRLKKSGNMSKM